MHAANLHRKPPKKDNLQDKSIKYAILPSENETAMKLVKVTSGWLVYVLSALIVLLAVYTALGDRGAIHLWRLRGEKTKLDAQNFRLQKENETLRQRVALVRNNNFYLEKLAREELNLARPGEVIYRFPAAQTEQADPPGELRADSAKPKK
jgi:cell division protein FtsB